MKLNQCNSFFLLFFLFTSFLLPLNLKAQEGAREKPASIVKIISFSCVPDETIKGKLLLQWSADHETTLSHFVLERSTDGKKFSDAAIIFVDDNAEKTVQYKFRDIQVASRSGKVYYRFRLVHSSGEVSYSDVWTFDASKKLVFKG